ncbi:Hint domain-containing protein [Pseudobacteriovorax antillogorgiicola]|uniref:Intein N-terminal splicing region n=1 Tax=Pseudobacteriovorax antillogorgiicola TaxID=1513793 RepID=A0A1Y6CIZ4_9BACT|nr:Hint domain-containing protein [Pseudobacteriovorax antillogorgiicola]TCS47935.1 intein [Pseudobacteriovorax antillogorgiicola]SMF58029.1 intein N-terminal splicing region [Pseudobacteriovorax antillogorgiicola]
MVVSLKDQSGVGVLGLVLILAGGVGLYAGVSSLKAKNSLKASDLQNASQEGKDINFNSLTLAKALASGENPAIYPEPYLPIVRSNMEVNPSAKSKNKLWRGGKNRVNVYSKSYNGDPKGSKSTTNIKFGRLITGNSDLPYLITGVATKARTRVSQGLADKKTSIISAAGIAIPPPPAPGCKIEVDGRETSQPFSCKKKDAEQKVAVNEKTGTPIVDEAGNPIVITVPPVYGGCAGAGKPWTFETDVGQTVTLKFIADGVVVDARTGKMPGMESEGAMDFPTGMLEKTSTELPYPEANSIYAKNVELQQLTYTAQNSNWVEMKVQGPDGNVGTCFAGIHVNKGPEENTEADSWHGSSLVEMADRTFKPMKDLMAGDLVWNPKLKKPSQIIYVFKSLPNQALVELKMSNGVSVQVTAQHPFITDVGINQAVDIRPGDRLPSIDGKWLTVLSTGVFKSESGQPVFDLFLNPDIPLIDRMINVDGLQVPSYRGQSSLSLALSRGQRVSGMGFENPSIGFTSSNLRR